jgi:hypothetical protein
MSIVEQAATVHDASGGSLSNQIAAGVMDWARQTGAFKHMVSFNMLDEAVQGGLGGRTARKDVSSEHLGAVAASVRRWIQPHLAEGRSTDGIDRAVSEAFHRPKGLETKGRDDVEPTIVTQVDRAGGR